jgi:sphingosine kinase
LAKKNKAPLGLVVIEGGVEESAVKLAKAWVETLMKAVYDGTLGSPSCRFQVLIFSDVGLKRSRRFMVFVNPYGGTVGAYPTTKQVQTYLSSF